MPPVFGNNHYSTIISNSFNYTAPSDGPEILAWLSPLEPWVRHRDIEAQRVDGIGNWLLETPEFKRWHEGSREDEPSHATLLCDGNPGVGKSHIISLVIDKLCDEAVEGDTAVACFYFDFAARNEQSPVNMLGSLLKQLVSGLSGIPEVVVDSFRKEKMVTGGRGLQVSGILKMLQRITATRRTFICVDALDECVPECRVVVLESLGQILQGSSNTRIFMTGRPQVRSEVERKLGGAVASVSARPTEDGIVRYLRDKLRCDTAPNIMNSALEAEIIKSIPKIYSETLLLASLRIKAVLRGTTVAQRRKVLESIKGGAELGDAYGVTLERITAQDEEMTKLAMATLTWVCYSERRLQVDELCHALAVEIGATDFDPENVPLIDTLLHCCQGLISVDEEASTVRLIHYTVQEYLCSRPDLFSKPHSTLAETCLTYLNSRQVQNLTSHPLPDHQSMPFLKYSSRYWGVHARMEPSTYAMTLALEVLGQYEDHVSAVSLLMQVVHPSYIRHIGTSRFFFGLHCASFFGIVELVTAFINVAGCEINQQDCVSRTPLAWAAVNGHIGAVKLLLGRGDIDPNRPDKYDLTPLGCAALEGHEGVVKLLLEREDVDPNQPDMNMITPLGWAAGRGYEGVVKLLLDRGNLDPNQPDVTDRTPLGRAACEGHGAVVRLLLEREDVDPNRPDKDAITPLGLAAGRGHEGVVKLLLERDNVDPNRPNMTGQTPLGLAAYKGHGGVAKLLLEREDVDPNRPDKYGRTPLGCAALKGYEGVVKLLLEREDVDPNRPDENVPPLGLAAGRGHEGVVKLLLGWEDIDINRPDVTDRTPLGRAAREGHGAVVRLLLERGGVDPNRPDKDAITPLGSAAGRGHEGVVKLLLGWENIDTNRPDVTDRTPLGRAACEGHGAVVRLLLEREDVDPNWPDKDAITPLGWAAGRGYEGVVKLLLDRENLDPNHPDAAGRTPLGRAAYKGHGAVVRLLLEREDVDPDRPDKNAITPLGLAAGRGHEGVVKLLLERDNVDSNRPNVTSLTPLGLAAYKGHGGVVKLLLEREDVDPNRSDENVTPLGLAAGRGHGGVVKLLLERGDVDPNRPDKYGRTPLGRAALKGHEEVVKLLLERQDIDSNLPN